MGDLGRFESDNHIASYFGGLGAIPIPFPPLKSPGGSQINPPMSPEEKALWLEAVKRQAATLQHIPTRVYGPRGRFGPYYSPK